MKHDHERQELFLEERRIEVPAEDERRQDAMRDAADREQLGNPLDDREQKSLERRHRDHRCGRSGSARPRTNRRERKPRGRSGEVLKTRP